MVMMTHELFANREIGLLKRKSAETASSTNHSISIILLISDGSACEDLIMMLQNAMG